MKPKNLIPLVIIVAVLAGLVILKQTTKKTPPIIEQTKLVRLMPEGITKGDIHKLELFAGGKPDEKLVLAYDAESDKWRVSNHFNSPAKKETVDKYLDAIVKLKGEPRTMGAAESDLAEYELTDQDAFHVAGYKKDETEPFFHILVGKSPAYKTVFIRKQGSNDVFVEETDLRQQAGIYSSDRSSMMGKTASDENAKKEQQKPEANIWLDKDVLKLTTGKITKVAMTMPDKSLVFEKREKPAPAPVPAPASDTPAPETPAPAPDTPAPAPAPAGSAEEESASETPVGVSAAGGTTAAAPPKEYEWVVVSGDPGFKLKESGVQSLVQKLATLTATDIVDPSKKAEWGLENPAYVCIITVEELPEVRLEGGRPSPSSEDAYVRVASAKEDIVYKLSKYTFEQIFPRGMELFELPQMSVNMADINSVEIQQPQGKVVLTKSGDSLQVTFPTADLELQKTTIDSLASALSEWKPVDYAGADQEFGDAIKVLTVAAGGTTSTIQMYGDAKHVDGAYVRINSAGPVLVMSRSDVGKIFIQPKDLYKLLIHDLDESNIAQIDVAGPTGKYTLRRDEKAWKLVVDGVESPAKTYESDLLARNIGDLEVSNVVFGQPELSTPAETTINFKMKDGTAHVFAIGPEKDGEHEIKVAGKAQIFKLTHAEAMELMPAPDTLKEVPSAPEPAAQAAPAAPPAPVPAPAPEAPAAPPAPVPAPAPDTSAAPPAPVPAPALEAPAVPPVPVPAPAPEAPAVPPVPAQPEAAVPPEPVP